MVVFFHAHISFRGGYIGVDVFFVISGYLITLLMMKDLEADQFSLADFWERRFRRIFPALAVMIFFTVTLGFFLLLPEALMNLGASLQAQTLFISNLFFWKDSSGYFAGPAEEKALLHTWSLAVEEQFYIVMPLLCLLIRSWWASRPQTRTLRETSFRIFIALLSVSFAVAIVITWIDSNAAFYWLPTRAWELMLGSCLACLPADKWMLTEKPRVILSWSALLTILIVGWVYNKRTLFPGLAAAPPCLATAFLIWVGQPQLEKTTVSRILASRLLVYIGLASYSFYLWHWPVLAFMNYLNPETDNAISKSLRIALMLVVFFIALASLRWIETPIRKRLWLKSRGMLLSLTIILLIAMFGIGWLIRHNQGFPQRLNQAVTDFAEAGTKDRAIRAKLGGDNPEQAFSDTLPSFGSPPESAPIKVLIWGDSHASSILPPIATLCETHGVKGLIASHSATVPILGGYFRPSHTGLDTKTPAWAAAVVNLVKKHHIPDTILTAYWKESSGKNEATFSKALIQTVIELKASGTRVWVMLDVPDLGFDAPKALAFHQMLPWLYPDPRKISPTLAEHEEANRVTRGLVTQLEKAGATVLDPSPFLFSPKKRCLIEVDKTVLYSDSHHLTISGAQRLKPLFEVIFKS